ncbi:hypothetical protein F2Q69_00020818 [Brassica cretica]|uniref:Uncharacterized protein n=1 Tax=Brassica cretica TaxID=69181 RepID=A0A8S9QBC9_BRACR|nr:hypothetical protein F2Q69_00020818 [Brassica cretica]
MPSSACNLIAFFSSYSVSTNSISTLLLQLHSQNSSLLQNQNHNPWVCLGDPGVFVDLEAFVEDKTHHLSWRSNHYRRLSVSSQGTINLDDPPTKRHVGVKAAKGGRSKRGMEDDKSLSAFHTMWSLKEKDLAGKEKLSKMGLLDRLIAKTEPLSEEEEALKKKLIREMLAN